MKWYLLWQQLRKALDVAGGRKQYERLLLEQRRSRTSSLYSCAYQPAMGTTFVTARYHSIEFNYLYCVALSVHRLVPHRPTSTAVVNQQGGTPTGWNAYWVATIRMCNNMCKMTPPAVSFKAHISSKSKSKRLTFQY